MRRYLFLILFLFSCQVAYGDTIDGIEGVDIEIAQWDGISAPSVSPTNSGRVYYDSTADTMKVSVNGGAYSDIISSSTGLKLDQTTPQTVVNGTPIFQEGIAIGDGAKTIKKIDADTVGLYVNGELIMAWRNAPDSGQYLGFGAFTQA